MRLLAAALAFAALSACASQPFVPGPPAKETRNLSGFDRIDVSRAITVIYTQGPAFTLEVDAPEGYPECLTTKVVKGELKVSRDSGMVNTKDRPKLYLTVTAPTLYALKVDSGSVFQTQGIFTPAFDLTVASGAEADVFGLETGALKLKADTGGTLNISGTCDSVNADVFSGAVVKGADLSCTSGDLDGSTGGELTVTITEEVSTKAAIGSEIVVYGNPAIRNTDQTVTGTVVFRD